MIRNVLTLVVFLAAGTLVLPGQEQKLAENQACPAWFFNYPEAGQVGTMLEVTPQSLRDPRNLKSGTEDWLKYFEVPEFQQVIGQKVAGLTLYYDKCKQLPALRVFRTLEELPAVAAALTPTEVANPQREASAVSCDPNISWATLYHGKSGKKVPFARLVKDGKLTEEESKNVQGRKEFLDILEASQDTLFSIRRNGCDKSISVMETSTVAHMVVDEPAAQGVGAVKKSGNGRMVVSSISASGSIAAAMFIGPAGLLVGPAIEGIVYIGGKIRGKGKKEELASNTKPGKPDVAAAVKPEVIAKQQSPPVAAAVQSCLAPPPPPIVARATQTPQQRSASGAMVGSNNRPPLDRSGRPIVQSNPRSLPQTARNYPPTTVIVRPYYIYVPVPMPSRQQTYAYNRSIPSPSRNNYRSVVPPSSRPKVVCRTDDGRWHRFGECSSSASLRRPLPTGQRSAAVYPRSYAAPNRNGQYY